MPTFFLRSYLLRTLLGWLALLAVGHAQLEKPSLSVEPPLPVEEPSAIAAVDDLPPLPPRPASHLLDESGMFPEAAAKSLSTRLLSSQTRTGLGIYLCVHTYLLEEDSDQRARRTHAAWLDGQIPGIVVVHDRSTGRLSFAGSDDKRMPDADGLRALYRLADATSKNLPPEAEPTARLTATLTTLADGLEAWQKNGRLPAPPPPASVATRPPPTTDGPPPVQAPWTRPNTFLIDEAGIFPDPAAATRLRQRLDAWSQETGLRLYVVSVTYPPETSGLTLANRLAVEWLHGSLGGIIVFDRSQPDVLSFAGTPQADRWLSPVHLEKLHAGANDAATAAGESPSGRLEAAAAFLTTAYTKEGLPRLRASEQWIPQAQRRFLPWILASFAACAGVLYLFQRWQERSDRRRTTTFLFPEVYVPQRLGAPHGGGVTAEAGTDAAAPPTTYR